MDRIGEQNSQSYLIFKIIYKISFGMDFCQTWYNSDSQQNTSGAYY